MTTDTLREAVARAMRRQFNVYHFDRSDDSGWEADLGQADAALSAIEAAGWRIVPADLTKEMIAAVRDKAGMQAAAFAIASWSAMLSAAPRLDATVRSGEEG